MAQKKRKFNFIDLIIVLLIVGVIGAAAYIFGAKKLSGGSDTVNVEYVLEFRQVRDEFLDCFETGVNAARRGEKVPSRRGDSGRVERVHLHGQRSCRRKARLSQLPGALRREDDGEVDGGDRLEGNVYS